MEAISIIENCSGCLDVRGFLAAGVHCDVRNKRDDRLDLALIVSESPCHAAGAFTRNRLAAAPVRLSRAMLESKAKYRGIITNSGNANACTGTQGLIDAEAMQKIAAEGLGCSPGEIFVCSTGRIGEPLPMDRISKGIRTAVEKLGAYPESGLAAADAILTSDTRRKICSVEVATPQGKVRIGGMAKGAGMIEPNMATMLAFICTDAEMESDHLRALLMSCVKDTFNCITVDGDESTNDTVLVLANGASGISIAPGSPEWEHFASALRLVCMDLARKIVGDGEKITKVVEVCIEGAASHAEAALAARAVANSLLVKSSWYGNDPNWGRIIDAIGYSGASVEESSIKLWYGLPGTEEVPVFSQGVAYPENKPKWKSIVSGGTFVVRANLGVGSYGERVWSTDLTEGYVNFNKSE